MYCNEKDMGPSHAGAIMSFPTDCENFNGVKT